MRTLLATFKKHLDHAGKTNKPSEVAGIHATILSILLGIFSAYFFYSYGELRGMQKEALEKADEINHIQFVRSAYMPQDENIFMASGHDDIEQLKNNLIELILLTSNQPGGVHIGKKTIPEDSAERAERILMIMNIVSHRYPFPKAIEGTSQFRPEPILFKDIDSLRQWLNDVEEVTTTLKPITHFLPLLFPSQLNPYLEALAQREKKIIERYNSDPVLQVMGARDPYYLVKDFINGMLRVDNIYNSTLKALMRADNLRESTTSVPSTIIFLLGGFIVFVLGVMLPLASYQINPFYYIHLPLAYYTTIYVMIVVKIFVILN